MMYGIQEAFDNIGRLMSLPTEQLKAILDADSEAHERRLQQILEESRLRQIEMYRSMKAKYPNSVPVQELCDKQLAQLEAEGTGA